jgi:hypothetical protein
MKARTLTGNDTQLWSAAKTTSLVVAVLAILPLSAVLLWVASLQGVDVLQITDLGLVSVLPASALAALVVVLFSFCLALAQRHVSTPVMFIHVGVLIFMLYGITALIYEVPRGNVMWRHAGYTEYIMRTGGLATKVDAYFSWPSFFIVSALITEIAGFPSAIELTPWTPVFFNLLYLSPLLMIFRSATKDMRLVWLSVWFFYLTNWVGQDYFVPQGLNLFLYLMIVGILLRWFKVTASQPLPELWWQRSRRFAPLVSRFSGLLKPADVPNVPSQPWQRMGLVLVIVAIFLLAVSSHQLSPFFTLATVGALVVFNRISQRDLPMLMGVMLATWISFMTVSFLAGHIDSIVGDIGAISHIFNKTVVKRVQGSPEHIFVVTLRIILSLAVGCLGMLGVLRLWRKGDLNLNFVLLGGMPFTLLTVQAYGGEMLLRCYLFALPAIVFFAAAAFYTRPAVISWPTTVLVSTVSVALLGGFLFARYGNERMDYYTPQEVEAVRYLYSTAQPGSLLVAGSWNLPWKLQDIEKYRYTTVTRDIQGGDIDSIVRVMNKKQYTDAYLILTRGQRASAEMYDGLSPQMWRNFEQMILRSEKYRLIFTNDDAKIFVLNREQRK